MRRSTLLSITETAAELANGTASVTGLIAEAQQRIERFNPVYRAFSHLARDVAQQVSALQTELDAGKSRGPLHGLAVSVKGNIPVAGLPWTEGTAIHATRVAQRDAGIVARARAAGGVVLGTTTLSELAMYGVTNPFEPMGLNPWDVERTAGGSSTGAGVASALGITHVNIGTDSGGSIRNPAAHCGVVGFMPSIGALTAEGKPNHAPSLSTVSLIARSVADIDVAFRVLGDARPAVAPARRVIVLRRLIDTMCDDETLALFAAALERLAAAGITAIDADIDGWMEGERAAGVVSLFESGQALAHMDISLASDGIRARAAAAAKLTSEQVESARTACAVLRANVSRALRDAGADAIATPTWPFAAPRIDAVSLDVQGKTVPVDPHRNCFVRAANAIDACAITVPMGLYPTAGVPAGLHLAADRGSESRLLALAGFVETVLPALPPAPPLR